MSDEENATVREWTDLLRRIRFGATVTVPGSSRGVRGATLRRRLPPDVLAEVARSVLIEHANESCGKIHAEIQIGPEIGVGAPSGPDRATLARKVAADVDYTHARLVCEPLRAVIHANPLRRGGVR